MGNAYEKIKDERKQLVNKIITNLKKGYILPWKQTWNSQSLRPHNPVSNAFYKGGNRLKLMIEAFNNEYNDSRWITYKQAEKMGWQVKKGEKGTLLEKWIFTEEKEIINEDGTKERKIVELEKPKVNYFYVYNAKQIHGIPELNVVPKTKDEIYHLAENVIKSSACPIEEITQPRAFYFPKNDKITLPPRDSFDSYENFLGVTLHEMGHSTGHETRLNRPILNMFGTPEYAKEELIAELTSLFTKSDLGININDNSLENHSAYIQSWIKVLEDDPNELFRACVSANQASKLLIDNYEKYLEQIQENEIINNNKTQPIRNEIEKNDNQEPLIKPEDSKNIIKNIKRDFQRNNFKCTEKLINNILNLNNITGEKHTIKKIHNYYKSNTYPDPKSKELINDIVNDLKSQELNEIKTKSIKHECELSL